MLKLVLLPGMDGTGELFAGLMAALPLELEAKVAGYPRDEIRGYAQLMEVVRSALPAEAPYMLVAESFSVPLAVMYAAQRPANLAGLVICCGFCSSPLSGWRRVAGLWLARWMFRWKLPEMAAEWWLVGDDAPAELLSALRGAIAWVEPEVMAARLRAVLHCNVLEALARVEVPLLYLHGTRDRLVAPQCQAEMLLVRPGKTVAVDGPHLLFQREPALTAGILVDFVRGLATEPSYRSA